MPAAITRQLNDSLATVLKMPDLREKLSIEAIEPMPMTPDAFGEFVRQDIARWTQVARERNIQLDS
jgi:tripartite-type tricarboxylate transporter receptor subunit TctC